MSNVREKAEAVLQLVDTLKKNPLLAVALDGHYETIEALRAALDETA